MLLEAWKEFEESTGDKEALLQVAKKFPRRIIKKRAVYGPDGQETGSEEYFDLVFPGEDAPALGKLFEKARMWKKQKDEENNNSQATEPVPVDE